MIIFKRGSAPRRAARLDFEFAAPPAPTPPGDPSPELARRRGALDRTQRHAALVELEARGAQLLDDIEHDEREDPFTLEKDAREAFDAVTAERFSSITDPALHATMMRKAEPIRSRFSARARTMRENAEDMSVANAVLMASQAVFDTAAEAPERVELLEPLFGAIDDSMLPPEHKQVLKTGVAARAVKLGLDDKLGPLFAKFREPGRRMLADTESVERQAARPNVVPASAEAPTVRTMPRPQPSDDPESPLAHPEQAVPSVLNDVFPEGLPRTVRQSLSRLEDSERHEFDGAVDRLRRLDAPDDVVRRVAEDVARGVNARQQSVVAAVPIAIALGVTTLVVLSLETQRRQRTAEGAGEAVTGLFDRLVEDMRGLLQEEGGDDDKPRARQSGRPDGLPPIETEDPDAGSPPAAREQDTGGSDNDGGADPDGGGRQPSPLDAAILIAIARQFSRRTPAQARVLAQQVKRILDELSPQVITQEDIRDAVDRAAHDPALAEDDPRFPAITERVAGVLDRRFGEPTDAGKRQDLIMALSRRVLNGLEPDVTNEDFLAEVDRRLDAILEEQRQTIRQRQAVRQQRRREGTRISSSLPKGDGFRQDRSFITAEQFELMPEEGLIDPQRVRTTQRGFDEEFQHPITFMGREFSTVTELSEFLNISLRTGGFTEKDTQAAFTEPIRVTMWNGRVFTLDHRRFIAFRRAGIKVPYKKVRFDRLKTKLRERVQESQDTQGGAFILNRTLKVLE